MIALKAMEISRRSWGDGAFLLSTRRRWRLHGAGRRCTTVFSTTSDHYYSEVLIVFDLTDEGRFTASGSLVTFTPDNGDPKYTGRVQGRTVIVDDFKIAGAKFALGFAS